jgi:hypothetical protein
MPNKIHYSPLSEILTREGALFFYIVLHVVAVAVLWFHWGVDGLLAMLGCQLFGLLLLLLPGRRWS